MKGETFNANAGPLIDAEWADISPPRVARGRPMEFDEDTLDILRGLPQPPEDDECERRDD